MYDIFNHTLWIFFPHHNCRWLYEQLFTNSRAMIRLLGKGKWSFISSKPKFFCLIRDGLKWLIIESTKDPYSKTPNPSHYRDVPDVVRSDTIL
ncbi:hypothetical protein CDAR_536831 [Caerostris darwini]|uniref:Maturase K n=1 Tax=Caerostris darwini TaxID=1538125 RepID=A0AAV4W908_9ARAC|nr:hypothetical protein CDAR_536831 [Caerostris darwini]